MVREASSPRENRKVSQAELSRKSYLALAGHYAHVRECPDCRHDRASRLRNLEDCKRLAGVPEDFKPEGFIEDSDRILGVICSGEAIRRLFS